MTKPDISSRADIELLIGHFYEKVKADDTIGIIFNEVIPVDWETHTPIIVDFWETTLLNTGSYRRNAMTPHFEINRLFNLHAVHFARWVELFTETVHEMFEGEVASLAVARAKGIAGLMQFKMDQINQNN